MTIDATEPRSREPLRLGAVGLLKDSSDLVDVSRTPSSPSQSNGAQYNGAIGVDTLHVVAAPAEKAPSARKPANAVLSDGAALVLAALLAAWVVSSSVAHNGGPLPGAGFTRQFLWLAACVPAFTAVLGPSRARRLLQTTLMEQAYRSSTALAAGCALCLAGWQLVQAAGGGIAPSVDALLFMGLFGVVAVATSRQIRDSILTRGGSDARRVLIVGSGFVANRISNQLASMKGTEVVGFVDDDPMDDDRWVGKLDALPSECERRSVDHVVVAFSRSRPEEIIGALRRLQGRLPITIVPRLFEVLPSTANLQDLGSGLSGIGVPPATLGRWPSLIKRTFDVGGAGCAFILLAPLLILVAAAIRISSRGPVLLRQIRVGRDGKTFEMLKFRSMVDDLSPWRPDGLEPESVIGPFPKLKNDPRITPVGRVIRRTSIDELPQLWNVLRGQMSLVGPRPFIPDDAAWINGWAQQRYSVRPGMTGLWQVSGRNDLLFEDMCRLDHVYVSSWSFGLDIGILLHTLRAVTHGRGAY